MRPRVEQAFETLHREIRALEAQLEAQQHEGDLVGGREIAELLGWSRNHTYSAMSKGVFPPPWRRLAMGPIWKKEQILRWQQDQQRAKSEPEVTPESRRV